MATVGQKRREILERLKSTQTASQGRIGPGPQSEIGRLATGLTRGSTRSLDIFGLAIEPAYGPQGPGVAGTIGELVGSIAPYLIPEAALARFGPAALRGRGLLPTAARSATSFGLVEFGRAPDIGETRAGNAAEGALMGAIVGASIAPKLHPITGRVLAEASPSRAALGGAAATAVPLALGDEVQSPVAITGNETADALIFNAALAGAFQALGRVMSSGRPPAEASELPPPIPPQRPPPIPPSATPPPVPRIFYQGPGQGPVATGESLVRRGHYRPPLPTSVAEAVTAPSPAAASLARPFVEPTQLELPGVRAALEQLGPPGEFALPRRQRASSTPIEPTKPTGPLVELVRSADEQATLEAKAVEIKAGARVRAGRQIALDEATAEALPEGLPGFVKEKRVIDTADLGLEDIDKLIAEAEIAGDEALTTTLGRTRAGLAGKGKRKLFRRGAESQEERRLRQRVQKREEKTIRKSAVVASQVTEQAEAAAPSPEEFLLRRRGEEGLDIEFGPSPGVEAYVDASERRLIEIESGDILPGAMHNKSKKFVDDLGRIKQGRSGDVYSYSNLLKSMKDMHTPIVGVEGDKFKVAFPDETIRVLSKDEVIARIEASLPPTESVPVFQGPDRPPIAEPIQQPLPGVTPEAVTFRRFAIPEPSDAVVLKAAEREAGTGTLTDRVVAALDADEPRAVQLISDGEFAALSPEERKLIIDAIDRATVRRPKDRTVMFPLAPEEVQQVLERRRVAGTPPSGGAERRGVAPTEPAPAKAQKPKVVKLAASEKKIDAFLAERGIVRTAKRIPARHKAAFVKGEAASKAIDIDISPQGVLVTDHVSGKKTRVKNLDEAARVVAASPNNEGPMRTEDELRSLFRRAFAGAKSGAHRNNIRKKYSLYSRYFPRTGEPLLTGEEPLGSLSNIINHRVPPTVDLTPPAAGGGGRINLPPDLPPTIPGGGPMIGDSIPFDELKGMGWTRYFRPMKFWALALEERSKNLVPAYTRIFAPLDEGRQQMQVFLAKFYPDLVKTWKPFARDLAARERIGAYLEAPDKAVALRELGISPREVQAADKLREMWNKLWRDFGYEDNLEFVENYIPWRRLHRELSEADALAMFYKNRARPRSYDISQELERESNGEWAREKDVFKLFHEYLFRGARKQFVAGPHAEAVKLVNEIALPRNLEPVRQHLTHFVDRMWGTTDASNKALNDFVDGMLTKLGVHTDKEFRTDFVSMLLQLNVGAHMAWRAPLAIRNAFQVFFVYPMVGERAFAVGLREAMTARGKAEAVKANIVGVDPVPFGDEIFNPFSPLTQIVRSGLRAYSRVDDFTRVVAYHATKFKVLQSAERYRANNWNLARFVDDAELDSMFHPVEARQIAELVRAGNPVKAAERAGYLMQENTNFIYRAGNAPEAFRGVAGRLFGQFGVWPVSYIEYLRYLSTFGTPNQRATKIARFMAANTAFGTAGTLLGVNTWKWLLFGPVVFTGGPMLQLAQDAGKVASAAAQGRSDDVEAKFAAARLKRNIPSSFIPGSSLLKDIEATIAEADRGFQPTVTRLLLGQSPEARFPTFSSARARRRAIANRLKRRGD